MICFDTLSALKSRFRTITTDESQSHSVINATIVRNSLPSETQIRRADLSKVTTLNYYFSFCQMRPDKITEALASQAKASTML